VRIAQGETLGKQCNGDVPPRRGDVRIAQGKTLGTCPHPPVLEINPRGEAAIIPSL
jgi:hypothetical protein